MEVPVKWVVWRHGADDWNRMHSPLESAQKHSNLYIQQKRKRFNHNETSHNEEMMEQEEAESDTTEPHPPNTLPMLVHPSYTTV